jgi:hypothetical protein
MADVSVSTSKEFESGGGLHSQVDDSYLGAESRWRRSLIAQPATTSHAGMPRAERERAGISEGLIRLSIGLEATADLIRIVGRRSRRFEENRVDQCLL